MIAFRPNHSFFLASLLDRHLSHGFATAKFFNPLNLRGRVHRVNGIIKKTLGFDPLINAVGKKKQIA